MQTHIGRLKTEPCEHSVVVIPFVRISGHLKVTDCFSGTRSRSPCSNPNLPQSGLCPFRTFCCVFVNTPRFNEMRFALCFSFHNLSPTLAVILFYPKPPNEKELSHRWRGRAWQTSRTVS